MINNYHKRTEQKTQKTLKKKVNQTIQYINNLAPKKFKILKLLKSKKKNKLLFNPKINCHLISILILNTNNNM